MVTRAKRERRKGRSISPLLANVYLHYVFDLWAQQWRHRHARGNMIIVRYADDIVVGFEHEADAERFLSEMRARMEQFGLSLHPHKTRLIEFGRHRGGESRASGVLANRRRSTSWVSPICGHSRRGKFALQRMTRRDRMRQLRRIKEQLRKRMHAPIPEQGRGCGRWSGATSRITRCPPTSGGWLLPHHVIDLWRWALRRRSQKDRITWERVRSWRSLAAAPRILHPWPALRRHSPEVGARCANRARRDLCGGAQQWASLPRYQWTLDLRARRAYGISTEYTLRDALLRCARRASDALLINKSPVRCWVIPSAAPPDRRVSRNSFATSAASSPCR